VAESPIHHRRHGTPPSTTKVSIVKQLTLYAAPLPLDCRWMELHYACPILAGDSWRPIVEVLATSAGFGWYASTPPCQTGDVLETAHLRRKVRPPGRRHVHRWGAGHGGELRRCLVLGIGLSLSLFRPGAQSPSVCTKSIDSLTSPFHSPSLLLPIQSHPEALPHHHLTPTTPAPVRGPDSPSPSAVCNTVSTSRIVSSRHQGITLPQTHWSRLRSAVRHLPPPWYRQRSPSSPN
jgi:hypothetical protein